MEWTDREAIQEARLGNQNAFRALVERHSHMVFRLAYRMTGNEQDAEDLVQETFLRAYKQLNKFDERAAFGTWLHRICLNRSLDILRARKTRREVQAAGGEEQMASWLEQVAAPEPSPERITRSNELARLLEPALEKLGEHERAAFVLRHYEGSSIEEIAQALGVEKSAAKHSVFRAVQKLRRTLAPAWGAAR